MDQPSCSAVLASWVAEPADQVLAAGAQLRGHIEGCPAAVAGGGVDVGSAAEEKLGGAALAAVAGLPEGFADVIGGRGGDSGEEFLEAGQDAERG